MRLGRIEILLLLLVVCGAVFMAIQYFPSGGPKVCAPVPLSPEVKAYIDKQLAANAGNAQCGDIPAVVSRLTGLEVKMSSCAKFEELRLGIQDKRQALNTAVQESRVRQTDVLARMRNAELGRLRNDMAMMCAGITVRPGGGGGAGGFAPGAGQRPSRARGNGGGGARGNGGGAAAGAGGAGSNGGASAEEN